MTELGSNYRTWILQQSVLGTKALRKSDDRIRFEVPAAVAEVNFYPYQQSEIVELRVERVSNGDTTFFLHFDLADTGLAKAEELFGQLADKLTSEADQQVVRVLLSCTSAFTTSLFAAKMNEVARTLKLDYEFEAESLDLALADKTPYAAIMLAPQAAYMRSQVAAAHPDALVFEIPGKVFGSYDAAAAIGLLMHALREVDTPYDEKSPLKAVRDLSDDRRVLVITVFSLLKETRIGWRLYDCGEGISEGALRKETLDLNDVGDLVQMLAISSVDIATLDAIAVAVPGVTYRGIVSLPHVGMRPFDLGLSLTQRFDLPVYVDNNCNAAAVGCYVRQDKVENLVFYRHAIGHPSGGMGTVIDGRVLKGHLNFAGEPYYYAGLYDYAQPLEEAVWNPDGLHRMAEYVSRTVAAIVAPDALYLAVDTVDDEQEFADTLAASLGVAFTPEVHVVGDYVELVYLGALAMALQKLRDPLYRSRGVGNLTDENIDRTRDKLMSQLAK